VSITRHPDTAWLFDFANGSLSPGFELLISAHVAACTTCAREVQMAEQLGAELMLASPARGTLVTAEDIMDADPADSAWVTPRRGVPSATEAVDLQGLVSKYLDCGLSALSWGNAGKGLQIARLRADQDERVMLLRAAPETVLPRHTHDGSELTLVLKGAYFAGDAIYAAGDVEDADESVDHQPVVTREGECLCLAVTDAPLRFRSWLPRLAQGFLGI